MRGAHEVVALLLVTAQAFLGHVPGLRVIRQFYQFLVFRDISAVATARAVHRTLFHFLMTVQALVVIGRLEAYPFMHFGIE